MAHRVGMIQGIDGEIGGRELGGGQLVAEGQDLVVGTMHPGLRKETGPKGRPRDFQVGGRGLRFGPGRCQRGVLLQTGPDRILQRQGGGGLFGLLGV